MICHERETTLTENGEATVSGAITSKEKLPLSGGEIRYQAPPSSSPNSRGVKSPKSAYANDDIARISSLLTAKNTSSEPSLSADEIFPEIVVTIVPSPALSRYRHINQ